MAEIGKVYNYSQDQQFASGQNIKISNLKKNQQVSQSLTRAQIKDATKRSATGGTGNITTPHTNMQTIQNTKSFGATSLTQTSGALPPNSGNKNMRTLQPPNESKSFAAGKVINHIGAGKQKTRLPAGPRKDFSGNANNRGSSQTLDVHQQQQPV